MQDFRNLDVWAKGHEFVLEAYRQTRGFPKEELFGLTSQLRRASAAIPTNIAEGCGRGSDPDFARFLQIAMGSAYEVDYLLLLCRDLGYLPDEAYDSMYARIIEIKRKLTRLLQRVQGS
jgi:four helix bundle protein